MDSMSVEEAAKRLGVSTKTVYRYLEKKKLSSEKIGLMHFIPAHEVEQLAVSRHVQTDDRTHMKDRVDTLYELFAAHDFRLKELEEQLRHVQTAHQEPQETPAPVSPQTTTPAPAPHKPAHPAQEIDLPAGTLTLQEFAAQMGIARRTLLELTTRHNFDHIALPTNRPGEMKRSFTVEQQAAIRQWREEHATKRP